MAWSKEDKFEVTHPSDWLETPLAAFAQIEAAFRCHVCKDFFESPMLTSCSHTFCSSCIRRCLSDDGKCPLCRADDQQIRLRVNTALREAVDVFVKSRPAALKFAKTQAASVTMFEPALSKRKASPSVEQDGVEQEANKRVRMSTRSSKSRGAHLTTAIMQEEAGLQETEEDDVTYNEPEPGCVLCPVCTNQVKHSLINKHLDNNCNDVQKTPQSSRFNNIKVGPIVMGRASSPTATKSPERLSELSYHLLKDQALRKKLCDLGISNFGTKDQLIRRHKEWVVISNANLDSAHPKTQKELLKELAIWEKTVGVYATTSSVGSDIKSKGFDRDNWSTSHSVDFRGLISQAQRSRKKAANTNPQASKPAEHVPEPDAVAIAPRLETLEAPETADSSGQWIPEAAVDQLPRVVNAANITPAAADVIEISSDGCPESKDQTMDNAQKAIESPHEVVGLQIQEFQRPEEMIQRQDLGTTMPVGLALPITAAEGGSSS